jgi:hypothetical protein
MESVKPRVVSPVISATSEAEADNNKAATITSSIAAELLDDATLLAKYALEMHILAEPRVLERINLLQEKHKKSRLEEDDFAELTDHYDLLNRVTGEVTPASLRATNPESGYWSSIAGRHLLRLWKLTAFFGVLIFLYSMLGYRVSYFSDADIADNAHLVWIRLQHYANFLVPFTYGALGSCAYLLRVIETKLKTREFDPARIPQHWNRLVLGTLSGGMVVMFIHQTPGVETSTVLVSEGALGFLAGYSIEFLFQTLDRLITALLPKGSSETTPSARKE